MTEASKTEPALSPPSPADDQPFDWKAEAKGVFWLLLAVLGFHSFIAKPFYIPSESMMPGLLVGDRLVVSKFPYGWSHVSPTFHVLPAMKGRVMGAMPERGDVVIATPPGSRTDYIKRVIGLPGDRLEMRNGVIILNGTAIERSAIVMRDIPLDTNQPCDDVNYPGLLVESGNGQLVCRMPIVRETLPNGRSYDTIDLGLKLEADDMPALTVPDGHIFLMGDNRDNSADSRFSTAQGGLGGAVPWENIGGRAEFITFSLDGSSSYWNPLSWFSAMRSGRAFSSLKPDEPTAKER